MEIIAFILIGVALNIILFMFVIHNQHKLVKEVYKVEKMQKGPAAPSTPGPSPQQTEELERKAQAAFELTVKEATERFSQDLQETSKRLNQLISKLTTTVVEEELTEYRDGLVSARKNAMQSVDVMQKAIDEQQAALQKELADEGAKRKQELSDRLDKKLGDAVTAYLVESLGQGVDLGAQRKYLLESLERNKDAIKKDVVDEL